MAGPLRTSADCLSCATAATNSESNRSGPGKPGASGKANFIYLRAIPPKDLEDAMATHYVVCGSCGRGFWRQDYLRNKKAPVCYRCTLERLTAECAPEEGDFNSALISSGEMTDQEVCSLQEDLRSVEPDGDEEYEPEGFDDSDDFDSCEEESNEGVCPECGEVYKWCDCEFGPQTPWCEICGELSCICSYGDPLIVSEPEEESPDDQGSWPEPQESDQAEDTRVERCGDRICHCTLEECEYHGIVCADCGWHPNAYLACCQCLYCCSHCRSEKCPGDKARTILGIGFFRKCKTESWWRYLCTTTIMVLK